MTAAADGSADLRSPLAPGRYRIAIRDLVLPWQIGVHRHEHGGTQRVRMNIWITCPEPPNADADDYSEVVCYERIVADLRDLAARGHVKLAETLAHRTAMLCLTDPRVEEVLVRVEKLDVLSDAASVGVELRRSRADG